jgi:hypothetical protein
MRIVSWNLHCLTDLWDSLDRDLAIDVALLQEAPLPTSASPVILPSDRNDWATAGWKARRFRTAIAVFGHTCEVVEIPTAPLGLADHDTLAVSCPGTITAAKLTTPDETMTLVSAYAGWEHPIPYHEDGWIYADASAHRLISDVAGLVDSQYDHNIIVAGDFNILHGYGEGGSPYWGRRYQTVFDRMDAIGLPFIGPQYPNGERVGSAPEERPPESLDVPTFRARHADPATATRQLDFVFASRSLRDRLQVRALNSLEEWGPSDHCRVTIDLVD